MVPVFTIPAVTWTLTAVLLLSGSYHLLHAARSRQLTDRINKSLHGLMNFLMAAMLWNLVASTMLVQIAVLAGAAVWFVIQAVARPEFTILCAGRQGRLRCAYHSLTMAGAAVMIAMMAPTVTANQATVAASPAETSHAHHTMSPAAQTHTAHNTTGTGMSHSPDLTLLLTAFFAAATVVFLVLLLRSRIAKTSSNHARPRDHVRAEHGLEALGAAIMALMFAAMTA